MQFLHVKAARFPHTSQSGSAFGGRREAAVEEEAGAEAAEGGVTADERATAAGPATSTGEGGVGGRRRSASASVSNDAAFSRIARSSGLFASSLLRHELVEGVWDELMMMTGASVTSSPRAEEQRRRLKKRTHLFRCRNGRFEYFPAFCDLESYACAHACLQASANLYTTSSLIRVSEYIDPKSKSVFSHSA